MKRKIISVFVLLACLISMHGQERKETRLTFDVSPGMVFFPDVSEGFKFSNGIGIKINKHFSVSGDVYMGYSKNSYEIGEKSPNYYDAKIISFRTKLNLIPFPDRFDNLSILIGPSYNLYNRTINSEYKHESQFDYSGKLGSVKTYRYRGGTILKEKYPGVNSEIELRILDLKNLQLLPFINVDYYLDPFYVNFFGIGIRTKIKLYD